VSEIVPSKKTKFHSFHGARRKTDGSTKRINERKDTGKDYREAKMIYKTSLSKQEPG